MTTLSNNGQSVKEISVILPARHLVTLPQDGDCCKKQSYTGHSITWILARHLKTMHLQWATFTSKQFIQKGYILFTKVELNVKAK